MDRLYRGASVLAMLVVMLAATTTGRIHGKVVSIDAKHGTFLIHHDPFKLMPMAMTMMVKPRNPADLAKLHPGEVIDASVDTATDPWVLTDIRPAKH